MKPDHLTMISHPPSHTGLSCLSQVLGRWTKELQGTLLVLDQTWWINEIEFGTIKGERGVIPFPTSPGSS